MTPAPPPKSSNDLAQQRTDLATERTHLADERTSLAVTRTMVALDRTLMAWIRTAVSLISFGFTIYKFFQAMPKDAAAASRVLSPRQVGMIMIALGVGALFLATIEYRGQVANLQRQFASYGPFHRSIAAAIATVIAGLGTLGFVLVFLRL